jgi:probable HAF family extracellular repeat protein
MEGLATASRFTLSENVMQAHHRVSLFLLSLTVGFANAAWAAPEYRVTVVGPANSSATDINNAGVVVGNYPFSATATHGFLNRGAGLVDLGTLGGTASRAAAINDKGQVVGEWTTAAGQQRGFIYYRGTRRDIGIIPGRHTTYTDINYAGYITAYGTAFDSYEGPHGFLRAPNGTFTDIGALPVENPMTTALALNNHKQVAGASGPLTFPEQPLRAIMWAAGVLKDLGDFGFEPNVTQAINDCGQMTGFMSVPQGFHSRVAFLFSGDRLTDIDRRPITADRYSEGTGINIHAQIVGNSNHLSAFIYRGRVMESLNALIAPGLGWDIRAANAINDSGQIAATAYRKGLQYAVRLDLIRPLALQAPAVELDAEASAPEEPSAADEEALAREQVRPLKQ